jgi:hypothetical protein
MKVVIVSYHFDAETHNRPVQIFGVLKQIAGVDEVQALVADYDHVTKNYVKSEKPGVRYFHVPPYSHNISYARIASYRRFARQVIDSGMLEGVDLVYVNVPDYFSACSILRHQARFGYRTIIDIVDLWPEALPLPTLIDTPAKALLHLILHGPRRRLFNKADMLLFQSTHFMRQFGALPEKCHVLPMCSTRAENAEPKPEQSLKPDITRQVNLLYLGSLNSITDVDSLVSLAQILSMQRKVRLAVVGGGAGMSGFERRMKSLPVEMVYHGITFDPEIKRTEFGMAHFGYNGYRQTTDVAVSYKSMDYLQNRLPILNSARGDSRELVAMESCGFNFTPDTIDGVADSILAMNDASYLAMSDRAALAYESHFSFRSFRESLQRYVRSFV